MNSLKQTTLTDDETDSSEESSESISEESSEESSESISEESEEESESSSDCELKEPNIYNIIEGSEDESPSSESEKSNKSEESNKSDYTIDESILPLKNKIDIITNGNVKITDLESLIKSIEPGDNNVSEKQIKLLNLLKELNSIVSAKKFKEHIVDQILFAIQNLQDPNTFFHTVITGNPGTGKCLGFNTEILMYNGHTKKVQDIIIGDQLMGDDGTPRNVLSVCKGIEKMYKVTKEDNTYFYANESHILSLVGIKGDKINISIKDYITSNNLKGYKLYKAKVNFNKSNIDGLYEFGKLIRNQLKDDIPDKYLYTSNKNQLELLKGITDNFSETKIFEPILIKKINFLANCLGYKLLIKNDYFIIVCSDLKYSFILKGAEKEYFKSDEYNYYYGFEIDGNRRFLLSDLTVTHNTKIINILAKIYCCIGILKTGKIVKADRSSLIGKWLGSTSIKTKEVLESAKDSVLIIDEVYSLGNKDHQDSFSKECIDTINQYLSENTGFVCIIAGYKNLVEDNFFAMNPGLERRFPWRFTIEDYLPNELLSIFKTQIKECEWSLHSEVSDKYLELKIFNKDNIKYFKGNGGDTKNLLDSCKISHSKRIFGTSFLKKMLSIEDINNGYEKYLLQKKETIIENDFLKTLYI